MLSLALRCLWTAAPVSLFLNRFYYIGRFLVSVDIYLPFSDLSNAPIAIFFEPKFLNLCLLNIRSLRNKGCAILDIRHDLSVDILLLVETLDEPGSICINQWLERAYVAECPTATASEV